MRILSEYSSYSIQAHDDLLAQWDAEQGESGPLELDLTPVSFMDPYGMVALVLFLNHLPETRRPVQLRLSGFDWRNSESTTSSSSAASYLTRMNFWEGVGDVIDAPPEKIPLRAKGLIDKNVLLEVTIFRTHDAISEMLHQTGEILQNLGYTVTARGHVLEVLSELCSNVLLHAEAPFGGVAAMQTYRNRAGTRYVVISIGDAGIGVRQSLAHNSALAGRLESDAQALGVAVQAGTSRFGVGGHGGGLTRVLEIAHRYGGQVAIRSGSGALAYSGAKNERRAFDAAPSQGTQLRISLPEASLRTNPQADLLAPEGEVKGE
jgi:anti-sigma regulatory factor (Ser/Thr protein kinase)